MPGCLTDHF